MERKPLLMDDPRDIYNPGLWFTEEQLAESQVIRHYNTTRNVLLKKNCFAIDLWIHNPHELITIGTQTMQKVYGELFSWYMAQHLATVLHRRIEYLQLLSAQLAENDYENNKIKEEIIVTTVTMKEFIMNVKQNCDEEDRIEIYLDKLK